MTTSDEPVVELLTNPGCPHAPALRERVRDSLRELGLPGSIQEQIGDYASPTVLIDGLDILTDRPPVLGDASCRLNVPTGDQVHQALVNRLRLDPRQTR